MIEVTTEPQHEHFALNSCKLILGGYKWSQMILYHFKLIILYKFSKWWCQGNLPNK